ncbi:MAG: hypothetical protein IPL78_28225 [Chloroflexi bacterium]|nr:hypothetical protein [Chloroflexota bacterium]
MVAARFRQLVDAKTLAYGGMVILCRASTSFAVYENALDEAGVPYVTVAGQGFYQRPEIRDLLNALQAIADPSDNLALAGLLRSPLCGLSDVALYELAQARARPGNPGGRGCSKGWLFRDRKTRPALLEPFA